MHWSTDVLSVCVCPRYQEGVAEHQVALVIHMTPEAVLRDSRYQQWMERYVSCAPWAPACGQQPVLLVHIFVLKYRALKRELCWLR